MTDMPTNPDTPLLLHGDCLDLLARLPDASVHAVVTDPPAGIGFMGKPWDSFAGYKPRTRAGVLEMRRLVSAERTWEWRASFAGEVEVAIVRVPMPDGTVMILDGHDDDPLPAWAVGFVVFLVDVWVEVDRVLKPGGFVCAWALPKTADLAGLAGRAVGWLVHDPLIHLFGGGMPKGLNIGKALDKMAGAEREVVGRRPIAYADSDTWGVPNRGGNQNSGTTFDAAFGKVDVGGTRPVTAPATEASQRWDGWNTQLAPGHEQWLLFRKPTPLTYAANVLAHCTGALHVDACRIPRGDGPHASRTSAGSGSGKSSENCYGDGLGGIVAPEHPGGSWPRNVLLTRGGEECPAEALDRQGEAMGVHSAGAAQPPQEKWADQKAEHVYGGALGKGPNGRRHGDSGGASRFFTRFDDRVGYFSKARDRGAGLRSDIVNGHPTHKHVGLMRWLVRLLSATAETTGGEAAIVLDPFAGSFTTGVACVAERVRFIGIERDASSFEVGRARVLAAIGSPVAAAEANEAAPAGAQLAML